MSLSVRAEQLVATVSGPVSYAAAVEKVAPATVMLLNLAQLSASEAAEFRKLPASLRDRLLAADEVFEIGGTVYSPISTGSGVIVDAAGHCVTNHHVIDKADRPDGKGQIGGDVFVAFVGNSKVHHRATLVGSDPSTDLAVLKLEGTNLPIAPAASSEKLRPGDVVLAIGAPHGLRQTVTMGIVSALHRENQDLKYSDFIQTDAAINPGNSGGPLVNANGEVIGINQSIRHGDIVSSDGRTAGSQVGGTLRSLGNIGIGYAIPIDLAQGIARQLIKDGAVRRGYLGLQLHDLPASERSSSALPFVNGVAVKSVLPESPAEMSGLKPGDVILSFAGTPVDDASRLRFIISQTAPDSKIPVHFARNGKASEVTVQMGDLGTSKYRSIGFEQAPGKSTRLDGVTVEAKQVLIRDPERGMGMASLVFAVDVERSSSASSAGVSPGMAILKVAGVPVTSVEDFESELARSASGGYVLLEVADQRRGRREITVSLGSSPKKAPPVKKNAR
jgi:serine protease Do